MHTAEPSRMHRRMNSAEPARGSRIVMIISLSLNVALVLFLVFVGRKPEAAAAGSLPDNPAHLSEHRTKRSPVRSKPWQLLESSELATYAANLRAAGCPAKTLRDILLPLIEEKFNAAELPPREPANIWASFSERRAAEAARAEKESAQSQERDNAIKALLGFAWSSDGLKQAYGEHAAELAGFIDFDHAEKLSCINDRFEKRFARAGRSPRIEAVSAVYQAWREEAGEVLSPTEFEEAELREILLMFQSRNPNLCSAGLSGAELRQLMVFRREVCNLFPAVLIARNNDVQEVDPAAEQKFRAKARSLLGADRFVDYLRSCDSTIDRILVTLEQEHLPKSVALQVFDLREDMVGRARQIRQQPTRRAEKRAQLAALRQSALEQLTSLSNGATDSPLIKFNMEWLQEMENP